MLIFGWCEEDWIRKKGGKCNDKWYEESRDKWRGYVKNN